MTMRSFQRPQWADDVDAPRATPAANANGVGYATFTFQVRDDGGTANGGANLDDSPNTIKINVTSVNDALSKVAGVKGNTAARNAESFEVTGDFSAKEVFAALNKAGLSGKVGK